MNSIGSYIFKTTVVISKVSLLVLCLLFIQTIASASLYSQAYATTTLATTESDKNIDRNIDKNMALAMAMFSNPETKAKPKKKISIVEYKKIRHQSRIKSNYTKSTYTKSRSKRRSSKSRRKRLTGCIAWDASKINSKASQFNRAINKYSRKHRVDSNLIKAVITAESCFRVKALSHAGAQGLMQLIPATAKRFGVTDSYSPQQNIRGGVTYLRFLLDRYKGNLKKTIAAYNAGEGAVDKYKGIPPYKETRQYVKNVLTVYNSLKPKASHKAKAIKAVYKPPQLGKKAGRHGWQYNRQLAPHLYKK